MGMPQADRTYTVDEVLAFPEDGNRYELVAGQLLVTPSPAYRHQKVLGRLHVLLDAYLSSDPAYAEVLLSPADIRLGPTDLVQPDLFVALRSEVTADWSSIRTLLLAVEIVSPGSARHDRVTKRQLYMARGVRTYWVVDVDARTVEVWRPSDARPEIVSERLAWRVTETAPELRIPLVSLFADLPPPR